MSYEVKKVFITGGAGFIGYFIAKQLINSGVDVVIYDAFLNYVLPLESRYSRYVQYRLNDLKDRCRIIRGDIRNRGDLIGALQATRPDVVIHLAAIPLATVSNQFSEEAIQINLNGTVTMLECIRAASSVQRFVYTSSSFVYGDFVYEPADEEHPKNPIDIYGGTKLSGEVLTKAFGKKFGIDYTIIRPSAVYGPTDANHRVSQLLVESAILGNPLVLHDGGTAALDFSYVKDTANGFVLAALSEKAKNETFNITRGEARTIKEFVKILQKRFPHLELQVKPQDEKRPHRGALEITKAKKLLGYEPKYSLELGIEEYLDFIIGNNFLKKGTS